MAVEIDETELANLRRVASIAEVIGRNPTARAKLQEAVAIAAPDQAGPETRLRSEFSEGLDAIRQELKADREARQKREEDAAAERARHDLENRWLTGRKAARDAGYTDEGLEKLEAFMEKNGVADHSIAIPAFERLNPPPEPVMTGGQRWNFFDIPKEDVSLKPLFEGNEDGFLGPAINAALRDVRGR